MSRVPSSTRPGASARVAERRKAAVAAWDRLGLRQQLMVLVASVAVVAGVLDTVWLAPAAAERQRLTARIDTLERDAGRLAAQRSREQAEQAALREREAQLRAGLLAADRAIEQARGQRIGPAALRERLRALSTHAEVRLVSLVTEPATRVTLPGAAASANPAEPSLYRHGLTVVVEGRYEALQAWLASLETSELGLRWSLVSLDGRTWPAVRLELRLFMLADQPVWRGS